MKSFIGILVFVTVLRVHVIWALQCYDCERLPFGSGRTDCDDAGYGSTASCLNSQTYCKVKYSLGRLDERACAETCTESYDPHGWLDTPHGTHCCTTNHCNAVPDYPKSGLRCYYCGSQEDCDDTDGTYGQAEDCIQGKNVCKATFVLDEPYKRECAESCGTLDIYSNNYLGRNGIHCCDTNLCNGPGPDKSPATSLHATLTLSLAGLMLATLYGII